MVVTVTVGETLSTVPKGEGPWAPRWNADRVTTLGFGGLGQGGGQEFDAAEVDFSGAKHGDGIDMEKLVGSWLP